MRLKAELDEVTVVIDFIVRGLENAILNVSQHLLDLLAQSLGLFLVEGLEVPHLGDHWTIFVARLLDLVGKEAAVVLGLSWNTDWSEKLILRFLDELLRRRLLLVLLLSIEVTVVLVLEPLIIDDLIIWNLRVEIKLNSILLLSSRTTSGLWVIQVLSLCRMVFAKYHFVIGSGLDRRLELLDLSSLRIVLLRCGPQNHAVDGLVLQCFWEPWRLDGLLILGVDLTETLKNKLHVLFGSNLGSSLEHSFDSQEPDALVDEFLFVLSEGLSTFWVSWLLWQCLILIVHIVNKFSTNLPLKAFL